MKDRYQIVTHSYDSGIDEKPETDSLKAAHQLIYAYMTEPVHHGHEPYYDSACIFDHKTRKVVAVYNFFDQDRYISEECRNPAADCYYIAQVNR